MYTQYNIMYTVLSIPLHIEIHLPDYHKKVYNFFTYIFMRLFAEELTPTIPPTVPTKTDKDAFIPIPNRSFNPFVNIPTSKIVKKIKPPTIAPIL